MSEYFGDYQITAVKLSRRILKGNPSKIVFLNVEKDTDSCRAALRARDCGYVLKPRVLSDLLPAIALVNDGVRFVSLDASRFETIIWNGSSSHTNWVR